MFRCTKNEKFSEGETRAWGEASLSQIHANIAWLLYSIKGTPSLHVVLVCLGNEICLNVLNTITFAA